MKTRNMKGCLTNLSLFLGVIFFVGCNAQGEFYDKEFLEGLGDPRRLNWCSIDTEGIDDPVSVCESSSGCQAMLDVNMDYIECIPVLSPNPGTDDGSGDTSSGGGDTGTGDGTGDGTTSGGDGGTVDDGSSDSEEEMDPYEDAENPGQEYQYICEQYLLENTPDEFDAEGNLVVEEKILVCHYPNNDAGKAHTICIGRPGWENGHSKHDMDHEGACNDLDP